MNRRSAISALAGATAATMIAPSLASCVAERSVSGLRQSVCYWPFSSVPLDEFCGGVAKLGLEAVDLLDADQWAVAARHGLRCSTGNTSKRRDFLTRGLCDRGMHDTIVREVESVLPLAVQSHVPNLIVLFGNGDGRSDDEGMDNAAACLSRIAPMAESAGITVIAEMLNSKVDHLGYQGDTTAFGVTVAEAVNSPRVRLLYDIYHMQIMEGDVIRTIGAHHDLFAHYHTAGNPGRHELNDRQELYYPAIAAAIVETGFQGFIAHEFIPTGDWRAGLRQAREMVAGSR